jgi:tetratricopeptide (TPR) repeat protein
MRLLAGLVLSLAGLAPAAAACEADGGGATGWSRVRTAHFEVLTDAGPSLAGNVARRLEALRLALRELFPPREPRERLVVVMALASRKRFEELAPARHAQAHRIGGFFQSGSEWDTIVARVTVDAAGPYAAVDHEYAHLALNRSLPAQPLWVAEGLAELLSDGALEGDEVRFGAARADLERQARGDGRALASLFAVGPESPEYLGGSGGDELYGRSWALARWVVARHGLAGLRSFLDDVAEGRPADAAFAARLGPLDEAQATLFDLAAGPLLRMAPPRAALSPEPREDAPAAHEIEWRVGELLLRGGDTRRARAHIERALEQEPAFAPARLSLADVHLRQGELAAARAELERALRLAPDEPAGLLRAARQRVLDAQHEGVALSSAEEARIVGQLERALARAPGLYEAALLLVELRPQPYAERLAALVPVFDADPGRTEVGLAIASLQMKLRDLAAAQRVLARAREAAREPAYRFLCERQLALVAGYQQATVEVRGRLRELLCRGDGGLEFMVEAPHGMLRLVAVHAQSFLVYGSQDASGESELVCGPQGRAVVVRYRPTEARSVQGELVWLMFPEEPAGAPAAPRRSRPRRAVRAP